jgi:hypothetical protein
VSISCIVLPSAPPRPCQNTTVLAPLPMVSMPTVGVGGAAPAAVGAASAGAAVASAIAVGAAAAGATVASAIAVGAAAGAAAVGAAAAGAAVGAAAGVAPPPQAASVTPAAPNAIALTASRRFRGNLRLVSGSVAILGTPDGCGCATLAGHNALRYLHCDFVDRCISSTLNLIGASFLATLLEPQPRYVF